VRFYETTVLVDPKNGDEEIEKNLQKVQALITSLGGEIVEIERKGVHRLGHKMKKTRDASYTFFRHNSSPDTIVRLKEQLKLNESILRFSTMMTSRHQARIPVQQPEAQTV
jgi:ribosomal protein S6